jgi:hypothetical protein
MQHASWRMKMLEQRQLKVKGAGLIYLRISLLIKICDDEEFQADCDSRDVERYDILDDELDDVGFDFLTLRRVWELNPSEDVWTSKSLRVLVAESVKKDRPSKENPAQRLSWKDRCRDLEKECERLRAALNAAGARIEELERIIKIFAVRETSPTEYHSPWRAPLAEPLSCAVNQAGNAGAVA